MYEIEVNEIEQMIQKQNRWREKCINLIASESAFRATVHIIIIVA